LRYAYTKNRLGMITGLQIYLSFDLLRPTLKKRRPKPVKPDRTQASDTNTLIKDSSYKDPELDAILARFEKTAGFG